MMSGDLNWLGLVMGGEVPRRCRAMDGDVTSSWPRSSSRMNDVRVTFAVRGGGGGGGGGGSLRWPGGSLCASSLRCCYRREG